MPAPPPPAQKKRRRQVMLPGTVEKHNPKDKSAELSDGLRRLKKMRVVNLNQQIAEHTKHKDLGAANACFQRAKQLGVANDFTFTNLINCHVRCGDVSGASKLLKRMRREGLKPGVIAYTTVIKGHAGRGDLVRVERLLREMAASSPPIELNVRTINTCLRGCAMVGAVAEVQPILARMQASAVSPDGSTREYAATLLCMGLRVDDARPLVAALAADSDHVATAAARLGMSRAALVLGRWSVARKAIKEFERSLDAIVKAEQTAKEMQDDEDDIVARFGEGYADAGGGDDSGGGGSGGRRGWRAGATRERSAEAFNSHRVAEWRREAAALRAYLQYATAQPETEQREAIAAHFRRVFFFRLPSESRAHAVASTASAQKTDPSPRANIAAEVGTAVCERVGAAMAIPSQAPEAWIQAASECFDDAGNLNFRRIFQSQQGGPDGMAEAEASGPGRPVHLEVGSGGGEWACAQAGASPDVDWVTLELRSDRVYHTFLNSVINQVSNLAMLGGDIHSVAARICPSSLSAIFVNHPEPPQQYDDGSGGSGGSGGGAGGGQSDGEHMLTPQFFAAAYRSLEPGGRLTIVTDNQYYARLLLQSVAALSDGGKRHFQSYKLAGQVDEDGGGGGGGDGGGDGDGSSVGGGGGITVEESSGEMFLYRGQPGPACGHAVVASSYFDRLWKTGASKSASASARYMLCLRREGQALRRTTNTRPVATVVPSPSTEEPEGDTKDTNEATKADGASGDATSEDQISNKKTKKTKKEKKAKKEKKTKKTKKQGSEEES